jgi:hypothetical protein
LGAPAFADFAGVFVDTNPVPPAPDPGGTPVFDSAPLVSPALLCASAGRSSYSSGPGRTWVCAYAETASTTHSAVPAQRCAVERRRGKYVFFRAFVG